MSRRRIITEDDLTKDEVTLLGNLLQGLPKKNLAASVKLVARRWAEWSEPDGERIVLTPIGVAQARKLWPGLDEDPPVIHASTAMSDSIVASGKQLALSVPPLVTDPEALADALEAVIGASQPGMATVILEHYPSGRGLPTATVGALVALGLPPVAARRIFDSFRLARACQRKNHRWGRMIVTAEDMAQAIFDEYGVGDVEVEHLWVGAVDSSESLISLNVVAKGSLSKVHVDIADVFVSVLRARARMLFLAHNHPSCDLRFSNDDLRLTQRIMAAARSLDITVLDHVVVTPDGRYASLREEGALEV